jgi:hypothetical protein
MHTVLSFSRSRRYNWYDDSTQGHSMHYLLREPELEEPECIRGLTWKQVVYVNSIESSTMIRYVIILGSLATH